MAAESPPVARTRIAALAIMGVLTAVFLGSAVTSFGAGDSEAAILSGIAADRLGNLGNLLSAILILLAIPYAVAMVLLALRRPSGRDGTMLLATAYGLVVLGATGPALFSGGTDRTWQGVLVGAANLLVAWLAWHRATRNDIERAERRRLARATASR